MVTFVMGAWCPVIFLITLKPWVQEPDGWSVARTVSDKTC